MATSYNHAAFPNTHPAFLLKDVSANCPTGPENASRCRPLLFCWIAYYLNFSFHERLIFLYLIVNSCGKSDQLLVNFSFPDNG